MKRAGELFEQKERELQSSMADLVSPQLCSQKAGRSYDFYSPFLQKEKNTEMELMRMRETMAYREALAQKHVLVVEAKMKYDCPLL